MHWRSFGVKAALVCGLALGLAFGVVAQAAVGSAQTPITPTEAAQANPTLWSSFLDKLAAGLNIDRAALDSAILGAGTGTTADAVAAGTITQTQADRINERLQAGDYRPLLGRGGHDGPRGGPRLESLRAAMLSAAAQTLGITTDALKTELRSGKTLAEIAAANNTTAQAVVDAALAAATTELTSAVAAGTITQAQADTIYSKLEQRGENLLSHSGPGGRGGRGGHGEPAPTPAPTTTGA